MNVVRCPNCFNKVDLDVFKCTCKDKKSVTKPKEVEGKEK